MFFFNRSSRMWVGATLMLVGLAACHHKKSTSSDPDYTGFWLNESAYNDFNPSNSEDLVVDRRYFCEQVHKDPSTHGYPVSGNWNGIPEFRALVITDSGEIYRWTMSVSPDNLQTGQSTYIGSIREDGYVNTPNRVNSISSLGFIDPSSPRALTDLGSLMLERGGNMLTAYGTDSGPYILGRTFRRVSEAQLREYGNEASSCFSNRQLYPVVEQPTNFRSRLPRPPCRGPIGPNGRCLDTPDYGYDGGPGPNADDGLPPPRAK